MEIAFSQGKELSSNVLNYVVKVLKRIYPGYDLKSFSFENELSTWDEHKSDKNDVQILFTEDPAKVPGGHVVCLFYDGREKAVYVLDSMYEPNESDTRAADKIILQIVEKRYPNRLVETPKRLKMQIIDKQGSAIYALKYATMLLAGRKLDDAQKVEVKVTNTFGDRFVFQRYALFKFITKKWKVAS